MYSLADDVSILIEVKDEDTISGLPVASAAGKAIEKSQQEFGKAMHNVNAVVKIVFDSLSDLEARHVTLEFGVKLNGGSDAIIASSSAEANFCITLTWDEDSTTTYSEWND